MATAYRRDGDENVDAVELGRQISQVVKEVYPKLYWAVGAPVFRSVEIGKNAGVVLLEYEAPLDFCHSYDPDAPIDNKDNAPTMQGGLLGGILDNAMSLALQVVTGGRFVSTLEMNTKFIRPTRPGKVYAEARVLWVTGRVAFATASLFRDEHRREMTAFATSTSKMRKPSTSLL